MGKITDNLKNKRLIFFSRLLFVLYLIITIYFLLFSETFGRTSDAREYTYNLTPFKEINRYLSWAKTSKVGVKMMFLNIWGNVLGFIPFGFFVPTIFRKVRNPIVVIIMSFGFSIVIETMQLILKVGSFDVDDLLLNTLGGAIGYIFFLIVRKIRHIKKGGDKNEII